MRTLSLLTLAAAALALPAAADAASITYEGDTLVYRAGAERNWPYIGNGAGGRIRISDGFVTATFPADRCSDTGGDGYDCDVPARIRLELGDGSDRNGFSDGYTGTTPVEVFGQGGDDSIEAHYDAPTPVRLDGGDGNDGLRGYGTDDVLIGGNGDDRLQGDGGADELRGGPGNDQLEPDGQAAPAADIVDGGPGSDLLDDYVQYFPGAGVYPAVDLTFDGGGSDGRPGEGDDVTGVERVIGRVSGRYVLTDAPEEADIVANMDGGASTVEGRGGNDKLTGGDQIETIDGGSGDDRIEGGFNHDTLVGGPGKDLIYGDRTSSCGTSTTVCVPYGNDVIDARDGEVDVVDCGPGNDRASVDAIDVLANCETVDTSGAAPGPAAPGAQGQPDGGAKRATATLSRKLSVSAALRSGVRLKLSGATPGKRTITAKLGKTVVARGPVKVSSGGTATVTLTFSRAGKTKLRGKKKATLAISGAGITSTVKLG